MSSTVFRSPFGEEVVRARVSAVRFVSVLYHLISSQFTHVIVVGPYFLCLLGTAMWCFPLYLRWPHSVRINMPPHRDLWNCVLCDAGPACLARRNGACRKAHSLVKLGAPWEVEEEHTESWLGGVDRWYGQPMTEEQRGRVYRYLDDHTEYVSRPIWARGLRWFYEHLDLTAEDALVWDFGIRMDSELMKRNRVSGKLPFSWATREDSATGESVALWGVLEMRLFELQREYEASYEYIMNHPCHRLSPLRIPRLQTISQSEESSMDSGVDSETSSSRASSPGAATGIC